MYFMSSIEECHRAFEQYLGPQGDEEPDGKELALGHALLNEELLELEAAYRELRRAHVTHAMRALGWAAYAEFFKELADVMYTTCGMFLRLGREPMQHLPSNLFHLDFVAAFRVRNEPGDVAEERFEVLSSEMGQVLDAARRYRLCWESGAGHWALELALRDVLKAALSLAKALYLDPNVLFKEVHRSNMSKLVNGAPLKNEAGKFIKPPGWNGQADLQPIIRKAWGGVL